MSIQKMGFLAAALLLSALSVSAQEVAYSFMSPVDADLTTVGGYGFGATNALYFGDKHHTAKDIVLPAGTPVAASATGLVKLARRWSSCPNWGAIVVIEHVLPDGTFVSTIYAHLNGEPGSIMVEEGETVQLGQLLGEIGAYRDCWTDHLHFGVYAGAFGAAEGTHPGWLAGYLSPTSFPGLYLEPITFLAEHGDEDPPDPGCVEGPPAGPGSIPPGEFLANGEFDEIDTGWTLCGDATIGSGPDARGGSGSYGYFDSGAASSTGRFQQVVSVPQAAAAFFTFWVAIDETNSSNPLADRFYVTVTPQDGSSGEMMVFNAFARDGTQIGDDYARQLVDLRPWMGKDVELRFYSSAADASGTIFRLDSIQAIYVE